MKISYRQAASDNVVRQFRYYLVTQISQTLRFASGTPSGVPLREHPFVGPRYASSSPQLQNLRSWPVAGFEAIRIITFWRKTPSASFASCTASAMLNGCLIVRQAPD